MKINSVKKLVEVWHNGTYTSYEIGDCNGSKTQFILNYLYEKYGDNGIEKYGNTFYTFNYKLHRFITNESTGQEIVEDLDKKAIGK